MYIHARAVPKDLSAVGWRRVGGSGVRASPREGI